MTSESNPGGSPAVAVLVARQAAATPRATAVRAGGHEISYAQLNARANQFAHHLRGIGAGPDTFVGVALRRGIDQVVALLGVWKAGAGYLPLDPDHPRQRLTWMLRDARVGVVVAEESAGWISDTGVHLVVPGAIGDRLAALPATDPPVPPTGWADHAAYAIHTSGSTGRPKGVVVSNAGIANRIDWVVRTHGLTSADRVLQKTPLTFDASCWEVFAPLTSGGTVVLAPPEAAGDPATLLHQIAAHRVTILQVVPSLLRCLVDEPAWPDCGTLRLVFSAGEPLHAELVHRLLERVDVDVWNTYGPTECSIDVTAHRFDRQQRSGPVPIGRPIDGMRVLVLDSGGRPAPVAARGELYAGGVGVARGYLGQPARTAERFVPDPFGPPGSRLYRTGDLARWRPDGTLVYLGRDDHQVKVNGVRVEPAEVEAGLVSHPNVSGAVVTAFQAGDTVTRLAAYVQNRRGGDSGDLRGFLGERLPASHIPAVFVHVEQFPLLSNGKVDRAALPAPVLGPDGVRVSPRTAAERVVADTWRELFGLPDVDVTDDFFRLGGTSLQLTRLANRLRSVSGRRIPLAGLLQATTVEAQARLVADDAEPGPAVPRVARTGGQPLSHGQHRLWFLDQVSPHRMEWASALFLPVPHHVPTETVRWALETLVRRHESLRTRFVVENGTPRQVVDPPGPLPVREVETTRDGLVALLREESERGFDLERGPLVRALLADTPRVGRTLVLSMHHIVCDGWSSAVLDREFRALLDARARDRDAALPDLPVRYADYAAWQRDRLTDDVVERELRYWRGVLDGLAPLALRTDRPRPPVRDARGGLVRFTVPAPVATALTELGREHAATPFVTLLTAFATLLARHSGQWDVPVGIPVAGRDRPELEGVVGFFLNNLVARCRLDADITFGQALDRVRDTFGDAMAHQDLPFERLVADLVPDRDLARTPLHQVSFDLHDETFTGSAAEPADIQALHDAWRVAKTDLTLFLRRQPDGSFAGALEYATALFDADTVRRMSRHLVGLLTALGACPDQPLGAVDFVGPDERRLLTGWGHTPGGPVTRCLPDVFEAQVALTPSAVAVTGDDATVSYAELDGRANRLAHRLRGLGVGPESVVGVLLDRGGDLVAALLAVWKAEAAYVPLDPQTPAERVRTVLEDAGASVVVTDSTYRERFGTRPGQRVVLVDRTGADGAAIAAAPATPPARRSDVDRLAYVIFTSGSTGRPKGVAVTHGALANHVEWAARELAGRGDGGAPLFSSIAFDLVVPNLWAPLMVGQPVTVLPADLDLGDLGARLVRGGPYSFVKLTPAHLRILSSHVPAEGAAGVAADLAAVVVAAGEVLPADLADRWAGTLVNEYGPTETTVGACTYPVTGPVPSGVVPIGRPLPNVSVRVLDPTLRLVPVGVVGEVCVGGAGVARGYLNQPGLTAASFVPDPFGPAGARLYRTGDLGRVLPDGNVEFAGRRDQQTQIRGYRVEPAEITAVLTRHPSVREAVVVARGEPDGHGAVHTDLVAYVVPEGTAPSHDDLAAHCATVLPGYMVPAAFVPLAAIPLTPNGKVDPAALPAPDRGSGGVPVAARTVAEKRIAEIWAGLLTRTPGVHDSFFRAGGNSILAIRLTADIQAAFGIDLPVRAVFEGPTVAELAVAVEALIRAEVAGMSDAELFAESMRTPEESS